VLLTSNLSTLIVTTESIVEIRDGQKTDGFAHYPFEEVANQSFSIIVEDEKLGGSIKT